jgi:hypothetical protein
MTGAATMPTSAADTSHTTTNRAERTRRSSTSITTGHTQSGHRKHRQ